MPQPTQYEEDEYWQGKINDLGRSRLVTVRDSAGKWAALISALLGIFAAVAFTGALPTLDKLDPGIAAVVKALTIVALIFAVAATGLLARASGDLFPTTLMAPGPGLLKDVFDTEADKAQFHLKWGRRLGVASALIVIVTSAGIFLVGEAPATKVPPIVLAVVNGKAVCGKLRTTSAGKLRVGDVDLSSAVTSFVVIDACPS